MSFSVTDPFGEKEKPIVEEWIERLRVLQEKEERQDRNKAIRFLRSSQNRFLSMTVGLVILAFFWFGSVAFNLDLESFRAPATSLFVLVMILLVFNTVLIPGYQDKINMVLSDLTTALKHRVEQDISDFSSTLDVTDPFRGSNSEKWIIKGEMLTVFSRVGSYMVNKKRIPDVRRRKMDEAFFVAVLNAYEEMSPELLFRDRAASGMLAVLNAYTMNIELQEEGSHEEDLLWAINEHGGDVFYEIKKQYSYTEDEDFLNYFGPAYVLCQELRKVSENQDTEGVPLELIVHFAVAADSTGTLRIDGDESD